VHQSSLDDVFFALTGHPSSVDEDDEGTVGPVGPVERQSPPVGALR